MISITQRLFPQRAIVGVMIFLACFVSYMLRVNMSINIIAMVEPATHSNGSKHVAECSRLNPGPNVTISNVTVVHAMQTAAEDSTNRYKWNSEVQGLILGAFFWGYILTSMPGGLVAERFGATKTIGISTLVSAALTMLTPLAAYWHYGVVIAIRFIIGFMGGVTYPALHCLISKWSPPEEKGKFMGALMGGTLGTVITWPLLGYINYSWGWTWAFFVPGGIAMVWCGLWYFLVADTPDVHKRITEDEKIYILKCIGDRVTKTKALPPYKALFFSIPFWALTILHFGNLWGLYFLMTAGPKYVSEILGFNLKSSGFLAALPYLARMLFGFGFGWIGDVIRSKNWMTVTFTRKFFVLFSSIIPGLFLIAQTFIGCDAMLAVALITLSLGMNGASTLTNLQNSQDLAPNFAGSLYGIINCVGGTTGFITPALVGAMTKEHNGMAEWRIIFWIGALVYIGTGIVYIIFGTGEMQPWNNVETNEKEDKDVGGVENPAFERTTENTHI